MSLPSYSIVLHRYRSKFSSFFFGYPNPSRSLAPNRLLQSTSPTPRILLAGRRQFANANTVISPKVPHARFFGVNCCCLFNPPGAVQEAIGGPSPSLCTPSPVLKSTICHDSERRHQYGYWVMSTGIFSPSQNPKA